MIGIWKPIGQNPKIILKIWEGGNPGYEIYEGAVTIEEALPRLHGKLGLICWAMKDRALPKRHLARWHGVLSLSFFK